MSVPSDELLQEGPARVPASFGVDDVVCVPALPALAAVDPTERIDRDVVHLGRLVLGELELVLAQVEPAREVDAG